MTRTKFIAYRGHQEQETSYTTQASVAEAKVALYRSLLDQGKLTHVAVYVNGKLENTMVPQKGKINGN